MTDHDDVLARSAHALSSLLLSEETLASVLERVCLLAQSTVPAGDHCGVTLVAGDRASTAAATDGMTLQVDGSQYGTGEGPCLDAARHGVTVQIDNMEADARYPSFSAEATRLGIGASLSLPLTVRGDTIGALNVYSRSRRPWTDEAVSVSHQFADQAAVALANAQIHHQTAVVVAQLHEALESRPVIDQAKGILMSQRACTADEAFAVLRHASQRLNRKVRDLAAEVVDGAVFGGPSPVLD